MDVDVDVWYTYRVRCLQTAFGEWHQLCHLGGKRIHADDALEPPRVWIEMVREGLEDLDFICANQRLAEDIDISEPSGRTRLQQSEEPTRASALQGQTQGTIIFLQRGGRGALMGCAKKVA